MQELTYTGSGASTGQTDYYAIVGHLIGSTNGTTTTYDLTDAEGSVLTTLSSSAVLGEQIYGPYGNQRYTQGTMGTDKGYTGQFQDAATGLDYYNARYYDPVIGQFLSADVKQGNAQGFDPYSYVNGNPETATDPTGQRISCPPDCGTPTGGSGGGAPCTLGGRGCTGQPVAPSPTSGPAPHPKPTGSGQGFTLDNPLCNGSGYPAKCDNKPTNDGRGCYSGGLGHNGTCASPAGCKTINRDYIANPALFLRGLGTILIAILS